MLATAISAYMWKKVWDENAERLENNEHLDTLAPISGIFHGLYEKAKADKSIRTDIDEQELFTQ